MKVKICRECGVEFTGRRHSRYCSSVCSFWACYDKSSGPDGCWPWRAYRNEDGYGVVNGRLALALLPDLDKPRRKFAHRLAYQLHHGIDPCDLRVAHECDVTCCGNPRHLIACTQRQNLMGGWQRGRAIMSAPGEDNYNAKLTSDLVRLIRSSAISAGDLASRMGVSPSTIRIVRRRMTWRHVD
ncbi:HNH endonuclease [Skermanella aerolata]|uniref:HNH endonuclease n=1 Tax=Skermanella aerolata TaxID=393310 RepID=UPI003D233C96